MVTPNRCPECGAPRKQRSAETHDHYFALLQRAYDNLPENMRDDFGDVEHLRAWALVKAGFRTQRSVLCDSPDEARRVAACVRLAAPLSFLQLTGTIVTVYAAKSQSMRAMGKDEFQRSKDAVLRVLSELLGVDVSELSGAQAA